MEVTDRTRLFGSCRVLETERGGRGQQRRRRRRREEGEEERGGGCALGASAALGAADQSGSEPARPGRRRAGRSR